MVGLPAKVLSHHKSEPPRNPNKSVKKCSFSWEYLHGWDRHGALSELMSLFQPKMRLMDAFSAKIEVSAQGFSKAYFLHVRFTRVSHGSFRN